jgi:hypothetical protein
MLREPRWSLYATQFHQHLRYRLRGSAAARGQVVGATTPTVFGTRCHTQYLPGARALVSAVTEVCG